MDLWISFIPPVPIIVIWLLIVSFFSLTSSPFLSLSYLHLCTVIIIIRHGIMRSLSIVLLKRNILSFITTFCHKKVHNFYLISFFFFEHSTIAFDRIIIFLNSFQCHIPTISLEHFILWTLISSLFYFCVSLLQLSLPLSDPFPRIYLILCYVDCCTFM